MSWHFSQELVEAFSEDGSLTRKSYARLKAIRTASKSSFDDKKTGRSLPSQSGTMPKHSTDSLSVGALMSSLLGFPANRTQAQENEKEKTTTEISGLTQQESLGRYDPELSSWRTSPDCFGSTEELCSETLPKWGMTVGGELYPLEKPELLTSENGGGVWLTPRASDGVSVENQETFLARMNDRTDSCAQSLAAQVREEKTWPTPTVAHAVRGNHDEPIENYQQRVLDYEEGRAKGKPGKSLGMAVRIEDKESWPTPQSRDWKNPVGERYTDPKRSNDLNDATDLAEQGDNGRGGKLNPDWVEFLMGWPVGWTSLDPLPEGTMEAWETSVKAGTYWDVDPADTGEVPRLTDIKLHRPARLKAIGNGQVPIQLVLAVDLLERNEK